MKKIFLVYAMLVWAQVAQAALIDQDWQTAGDANVLYDTASGLRWLDLRMTSEISHDDVVANLAPGGMFEDFRLATQAEVLTLWSNAGITNTERAWVTTDQYAAVRDLVTRMGSTPMIEIGEFNYATHVIGMAEGGQPLAENLRWAMELTYAPDGISTRTSASYYTFDISMADMHYSTYLVQAVPLPGALWLFMSGGLGLLTLKRRNVSTV